MSHRELSARPPPTTTTLLFYTYDIEQAREALWKRAQELGGLAWTTC
jgi:hypothetical protein